jgi:hypothetical protein
MLLGQCLLREGHRVDQRLVLGQPDDVVDAPCFEAAQRLGAAETRVSPHDQPHLRPRVPQLGRQQLDQRAEHLGGLPVAGAQHTREHVLPRKHVKGQVAVVVVVVVEVRSLLRTVQRHMRRVDVQHQLARRLLEVRDEGIHQHFIESCGQLGRRRSLQPAQRRSRSQWLVASHCRLQHQVRPQAV